MRFRKLLAVLVLMGAALAGAAETIVLPKPKKTGGMPLYTALAKRETSRDMGGSRAPTLQELSDLLWCANGVTRPNGRRTAPSAWDKREIDLIAVTAEGVFAYDAPKHTLEKLDAELPGNLLQGASVYLIYHYNPARQTRDYALVDAGFVGQNVYLHCTAAGYRNVFLGGLDRAGLKRALGEHIGTVLYGHRIGIR